jgi:hypothetical protein
MLRKQSGGRRDDAEEAAKDARNSCSSILKFEGARACAYSGAKMLKFRDKV